MKKPSTKWVIIAILILFIAYSGFATYKWLEVEGIESVMLNAAIDLSDIHLLELSDVGLVAEYLIKPDTTGELLNARIYQYFIHARTLDYSSSMLRASTDDEKYSLFGTAMRNLWGFFAGLTGDRPDDIKEILTTNLDTLKQMDNTLEEILRINYLTLADAEKILQLSGNLTAG